MEKRLRGSITVVDARVAALLIVLSMEMGCGDTYRPVANPIVPNPPNPGFSHVMLVLSENGTANPGASTTIDVSGDSDVGQLNTGLMPVHAAFLPNSTLAYVTNSGDDTLTSYLTSGATSGTAASTVTLPSGSVPVFVATTENGAIYVANAGNGTVSVVSTINDVVINTIPVGVNPIALAETPDRQKLYVVNQGNGGANASVVSINTIDKSVNPPIGSGWISPLSVVARSDSQRIYVLDSGAGSVTAINPTTPNDTVVGSVSVGAGANFMVYDPTRNRVYVTNPTANQVIYLDVSSDAMTPTALAISNPVSVTALGDGTRAYVASALVSGGEIALKVTVINAPDGSIKTSIPLSTIEQQSECSSYENTSSTLFIAASADSTRVYVASCDAGSTSIIQTSNDTIVRQLAAPFSARTPAPGQPPPPQNPVFIVAGP